MRKQRTTRLSSGAGSMSVVCPGTTARPRSLSRFLRCPAFALRETQAECAEYKADYDGRRSAAAETGAAADRTIGARRRGNRIASDRRGRRATWLAALAGGGPRWRGRRTRVRASARAARQGSRIVTSTSVHLTIVRENLFFIEFPCSRKAPFMPAPATHDAFVEALGKSGLVDAERLQLFLQQTAGLSAMPRKLAARLVASGLLTQFQAEQLLQGKHRGFTIGKYRVLERI